MSETIDNGGPAFTGPDDYKQDGSPIFGPKNIEGISLRAWLAGRALSGLLANSSIEILKPEEYASDCLLYADALIAALKRVP